MYRRKIYTTEVSNVYHLSAKTIIAQACRGQLDELTGDGYWIPVDGDAKNPGTWIANSFIKAVLSSEQVQAKNVVVIADSCYSGAMLRGGPSQLTLDGDYMTKLVKAAAKRSRQVISSGGIEPVADGGADGHSLFAFYLSNTPDSLLDAEYGRRHPVK